MGKVWWNKRVIRHGVLDIGQTCREYMLSYGERLRESGIWADIGLRCCRWWRWLEGAVVWCCAWVPSCLSWLFPCPHPNSDIEWPQRSVMHRLLQVSLPEPHLSRHRALARILSDMTRHKFAQCWRHGRGENLTHIFSSLLRDVDFSPMTDIVSRAER